MPNPNDTDKARVVGGFHGNSLGSRSRVRQETGQLSYGPITSEQKDYRGNRSLQHDDGKAIATARMYGLPEHIEGNPLGCKCSEAHLAGATKPVGSHIEADYMCDYGYHNYVVFQLIGFEDNTESSIKVDANGNLIEDATTEPRELGDF